MTDRTLLVAVVAVLALAAAPLGVAGAFVGGAPGAQNGTDTPTPTPTASTNDSNASNASLGASVSAFMQASAAEADGQVDRGMFAARFNASDNETRDRLVKQRAATIEKRLERLRAEREALLDDDGNVTVAERAKAARLKSRIDALQRAINQTDEAATRANVSLNRTKLSELRAAAGNLSGPEVSEIATGLVDRPERGPPEDRRAETRGDRSGVNRTDGAPEDRRTGGSGNETGGSDADGAPEDAGNTSDTSDRPADGDASGSGSDTGDDSGNSDRGSGADERERDDGASNADGRND